MKNNKLINSWHCPISIENNQYKKNKCEEITFHKDGTYSIREDNGFGIMAEYSGEYKIERDNLFFKNTVYKFKINNGELILKRKNIFSELYEIKKYFKVNYKLKYFDKLHKMPKTFQECLELLKIIVPEESQQKLIDSEDNHQFSFSSIGHFGLGAFIRNSLGLWGANPYLQVIEPDSYSESLNNNLKTMLICEKYFGEKGIEQFKNNPELNCNGYLIPNNYLPHDNITYPILVKYIEDKKAIIFIKKTEVLSYHYINKIMSKTVDDDILILKGIVFLNKIQFKENIDLNYIDIMLDEI